ncbi:hypothetical protein Tco_1510703 [Tanacetum coccineum]
MLLPYTSHRDDLPEADMPLQKSDYVTAPTSRFEGYRGESTHYRGVSQRVTDLSTTLTQDTHDIYVRLEDAQDDRALYRGRVNTLFRDRRYHLRIVVLVENEARCTRQAWP